MSKVVRRKSGEAGRGDCWVPHSLPPICEPDGLATVEDFTALGDAVNITAPLASAAAAGEVIVSVATAEAAGITTDRLERRTVAIRGRIEPIEVIVLPRPDKKRVTG